MKMDRNSTFRSFFAVGWIVLISIAGFFVYTKFQGDLTLRIIHWELAIVGFLAGTVSSTPVIVIVRDYLLKPGTAQRHAVSFIIVFLPAIAKYIPGKIWSVAGFLHQAKTLAGISVKDAAFSQIYLQIVALVSSSILSLIGILFAELLLDDVLFKKNLLVGFLFLIIAGGCSFLAFKRVALKFGHQIESRNTLLHISILSLQKILRGLSLFIFVCAYLPVQGHLLEIVLAFIVSTQLGALAFFAPAGIGIIEGGYVLLLSATISAPSALSIAVIARVWQTGIDFFLAFIGVLLKYFVARNINTDRTR